MTAAAKGNGSSSDFNPLSPDGSYLLQLNDPTDRAVASQLCAMDKESPTDMMKNIKLDTRNIPSCKSQNWPDR